MDETTILYVLKSALGVYMVNIKAKNSDLMHRIIDSSPRIIKLRLKLKLLAPKN